MSRRAKARDLLDPAQLAAWNAAQRRAIDAYAQDESTRRGECITCTRRKEGYARECRPCAEHRRLRLIQGGQS